MATPPRMAQMSKYWADAKKEFKDLTGESKPAGDKKWLGKFSRHATGVARAAKTVDEAYDGVVRGANALGDSKKFAAFKKSVIDLQAAADDYKAAIKKEITKRNDPEGNYTKQADLLKARLKAMVAVAVSDLGVKQGQFDGLGAMDAMAANLKKSTISALKNAGVFCKEVKASPTAEVFNGGIQGASRPVTQNIGNLAKLESKGWHYPKGKMPNLHKVMTPWSEGKRTVPDTADEKYVLRELGVFMQALRGVKEWVQTI